MISLESLRRLNVSVAQLVQLGLMFFSFAFVISPIVWGFGIHGNTTTVLLGLLFTAVASIAIRLSRGLFVRPLIIFLSGTLLIFIFPRILLYLIASSVSIRQLYVLYKIPWSADLINQGLLYMVAGTAALFFSMLAAAKLFKNPQNFTNPTQPRSLSFVTLLFAFIVIFLIESYFTLYLGMNASANCIKRLVPGSWLIHFFSIDIIAALIVSAGILNKDRRPGQKLLLGLLLVTYATAMLLGGSRGGIFRVCIAAMGVLCVAERLRPYLSIRMIAIGAVAIGLLSVPNYVAGTLIRAQHQVSCHDGEGPRMDQTFKDEFVDSNNNFYTRRAHSNSAILAQDAKAVKLPTVLARIADRFAILDFPIGISVMPIDQVYADHYLTFRHLTQNFANNMLLGEPYPDARYFWASMMGLFYRDSEPATLDSDFHSEPFLIWGMVFVFGGFAGGIALLAFAGAGIAGAYNLFLKIPWGGWSLHLEAMFVWIGLNGLIVYQMSADHSLSVFCYFVFQTVTTIGLIIGIERVITWVRAWIRRRNGVSRDA